MAASSMLDLLIVQDSRALEKRHPSAFPGMIFLIINAPNQVLFSAGFSIVAISDEDGVLIHPDKKACRSYQTDRLY
jgi:hypothetical protein